MRAANVRYSNTRIQMHAANVRYSNARIQMRAVNERYSNARRQAVDLINDLLLKRTSSPNEWKQPTTALKGHSIPRELIGNSERWRYINKPQKKTKATTPLRPTSHTKTGLAW